MSKVNINKKLISKLCATTLAFNLVVLASGCKDNKKIITIKPTTTLTNLYDAVDEYTNMDEYVGGVYNFDNVDMNNLENEDMAEVNKKIYVTALDQLKGMILDAIDYPLELANDVVFNANNYTLIINSTTRVKVSARNIEDLVSVITASEVGTIRRNGVEEAYNIVKSATLLTGNFDNKQQKVVFNYDNKKINAAKQLKLVN